MEGGTDCGFTGPRTLVAKHPIQLPPERPRAGPRLVLGVDLTSGGLRNATLNVRPFPAAPAPDEDRVAPRARPARVEHRPFLAARAPRLVDLCGEVQLVALAPAHATPSASKLSCASRARAIAQ